MKTRAALQDSIFYEPATEKPVVLIDKECILCSRTVAFIYRHAVEGKFYILSLFSAEGKAVLQEHDLPADYSQSLVLCLHNKAYVKSDAALLLFREMKGAYRWLYGLIIFPRALRDGVYDLIARHRHKLFSR